jgi:hypothetical protein
MVYDNLPSIAFCPRGVAMLGSKIPMKAVKCPFYQSYVKSGLSEHSEQVKSKATMRVVVPNRVNVEKSLAKCNVLPSYPDDQLQETVEDYSDQYLRPFLYQYTLHPDQHVKFNLNTSPSSTWKVLGCKTKADAFNHTMFAWMLTDCTHIVLVDYCGKVEFLDIEDILINEKIRGFFNPSLDYNVKAKILYENQNLAFKIAWEKSWIKYGMVKQFGGFDRFARDLEQFDFFDEGDCSGYDRLIWLGKVYDRRNKYLRYQSHQYSLVCYVYAFIVNTFIICPDGVIRMRQTGNISGGNNTTVDNCMAHLPILIRFICKMWLNSRFRRLPTFEEIFVNHRYAIYSDDAFGAHKLTYLGIDIDTFMRLKIETYLEFGLVLKPKQTLLTWKLDSGRINPKHSFLGSYFYWDLKTEMYVPFPRLEKICSSLYYKEKGMENDLIIIRTLALMVLSAPELWLYNEISRFLDFLLDTIIHASDVLPSSYINLIEIARNRPEVWYITGIGK